MGKSFIHRHDIVNRQGRIDFVNRVAQGRCEIQWIYRSTKDQCHAWPRHLSITEVNGLFDLSVQPLMANVAHNADNCGWLLTERRHAEALANWVVPQKKSARQ